MSIIFTENYLPWCEVVKVPAVEVSGVTVEYREALELPLFCCIVDGGGPKLVLLQSRGQGVVQ